MNTKNATSQPADGARVSQDLSVVNTNARGWPMGDWHHQARHSDALVAEARRHHADGMSSADIARLLGVNTATCTSWLNGRRRKTPARIAVRWRTPAVAPVAPELPTALPSEHAAALTSKGQP